MGSLCQASKQDELSSASRQFPPKQGVCRENMTDTIRTRAAGLVTDTK